MMGSGLLGTILVIGSMAYLLEGPQNLFTGDKTPLEILKASYARGEISQQGYERMREDLRI